MKTIMDNHLILICNLSKGLLGEDTAAAIGTCLLAKIQLTALERARQPAKDRQPFYVYVDELQHFASPSYTQLLSEARKYGISLIMAEQSTAQQQAPGFSDVLLANVGTVVCFRTASPIDEARLLPLFSPDLKSGAIANLPSFHFYLRIAAVEPLPPLRATTLAPISEWKRETALKIVQTTRQRYSGPGQPALRSTNIPEALTMNGGNQTKKVS